MVAVFALRGADTNVIPNISLILPHPLHYIEGLQVKTVFSRKNPQAQVSTEGRDIELKLIQNVPAHTMLTRHYVIFFVLWIV